VAVGVSGPFPAAAGALEKALVQNARPADNPAVNPSARDATERGPAAGPAPAGRAALPADDDCDACTPTWRERLSDWRAPYLIPLLVLLATRLWFWKLLPFANEDAYITFRYARSLVIGWGLVFNPGEMVMGFSSPLWTVWNAVGFYLVHDPVLWSRAWSLVADVTTLVLVARLLERHASRASAWCFAAFFAGWTYFAALAVSGMENSAMVALVALAATLVERRSRISGVVLAALALMRPEGIVAAGVLGLGARRSQQLIAALLVAAACAALLLTFGSVIPQSVIAKASMYGAPGAWAGRHWWEWASPFPFGRWPDTSEGGMLFAMAVVLGPAAATGAVALWRARHTALARAAAAMVAVWAGYAAMGVAYFYWYLAVPLAGAALLASVGMPRIVRGPPVFAGLALFVAGTWTIAPELYQARAQAETLGFGRVADYIASHGTPGETILLEPIGMVGWRCRMRIVDEVGLVSPQVAERRLQGAGWMTDVVASERPDWLVLRRGVMKEGRAFAGAGEPFRNTDERDALLKRYHVATVVLEDAGDHALEVLRRVDGPLSLDAGADD